MRNPAKGVAALSLAVVALTSAALSQTNVTTYYYDNTRSGQNIRETSLTPANVNQSLFGKLFTVTLDGYAYAQPLYMAGVQNIAGGTHNVLYVATEHASLYAIDADTGAILWQQSFIDPPTVTTVSNNDVSCTDLVPEIGISGTPVIDPSTGTIYFIVKTKESGVFHQRLHAVDIVAHTEKFGGPIEITATFSGRTFNALQQHNRPGLLLENGHVIVAWASHCDNTPYQGWVISYNAATLAQEAIFNTEPDSSGYDGGIWMSGDGVAADASGNIYFATGNGDYNSATGDYGDSVMKLSGPSGGVFTIADWFTPINQSTLSVDDTDVGSGGLLLLPDLPAGSAHQQQLVQMGKEGKLYEIDRNNMGKLCATCTTSDTQIPQELAGASNGVWGSPAYWNGSVYWGSQGDVVSAWSFNGSNPGLLSTSPTSTTSTTFGYPAGSPTISANGTSGGILWALDNSSFKSACCQILYAYDATKLGTPLYSSNQAQNPKNRDQLGGAVKFAAPMVANGKVYVGGQSLLTAFGLISTTPTAATPTFSPAPGSYSGSVNVTLSDTTAGATIHCTTNGTTPTSSSPVCSTVTITASGTLEAIAVASGYNNSSIASGVYNIVSANISVTLKPASLAFGRLVVGSASATKALTLTNSSSVGSLAISSIAASGGFFQTNNCPSSLAAGGHCVINVSSLLALPGSSTGVLTIYDNAVNSPQMAALYASGVVPVSLTPQSVYFGDVSVGATSAPATVTATNNTSAAVNLTYATPVDFTASSPASGGCGPSLAAGSSCQIAVTFRPSQNGLTWGSLALSSTSFSTQTVSLNGTGTAGTSPTLAFQPVTLNFANQAVGGSSTPATVTVINKGSSSLTLNSLTASAGFAAAPSGAIPCQGVLAPGAQCTFAVTFSPTAKAVNLRGQVAIADSGTLNPILYRVSGSGVWPVTFTVGTLTFSGQTVGTSSSGQTISLLNNQSVPLSITSIVASGDFTAAPGGPIPCGSSVAAYASCNFVVTFTPGRTGSIKGTVTVTDNASGSPQDLELTGTGQ